MKATYAMLGFLAIVSFAVATYGIVSQARFFPSAITSNPKDRLAQYVEAHRLDPIFAFPGIDVEAMRQVVKEFTISARVAMPPYNNQEAIRESLFPFQFLAAVADAEEARVKLFAEPSREHADVYHRSLMHLMENYKEDSSHARDILEHASTTTRIFFFIGETSPARIKTVLAEAEVHANALMEKEERRFDCLLGLAAQCESIDSLILQFGDMSTGTRLDTLPTEKLTKVAEENFSTLAALNSQLASSTLVELSHSACYPSAPTYYAVTTKISRLSGLPSADITYLNDLYFYDLKRTSKQPYFDELQKAGAQYSYQPFNAYLCLDAGEDMGRLMTIIHTRISLAHTPLKARGGYIPPLIKEVLEAQEQFLAGTTVRSDAYDRLIRNASLAVRTYGMTGVSSYFSDATAGEQLVDLVILSRTQSADFEKIVAYFDDLQVGTFLPYHFNPSPLYAFLMTRGGLSPLLALENRTGALPQALSLLETNVPHKNPYAYMHISLRSYENDLHATRARGTLIQTLLDERRAHDKAFGLLISDLQIARQSYKKMLETCGGSVALHTEESPIRRIWNMTCTPAPTPGS